LPSVGLACTTIGGSGRLPPRHIRQRGDVGGRAAQGRVLDASVVARPIRSSGRMARTQSAKDGPEVFAIMLLADPTRGNGLAVGLAEAPAPLADSVDQAYTPTLKLLNRP
jgi:hypothetical protein